MGRAGLSRERVLAAAVALADEGGVEELSMRRLAKTLGVEAMSLYNHIANKDQLLDGMINFVFSEIEPPTPGEDWRQEMRKSASSTRDVLDRHRWAVGLQDATRHKEEFLFGLELILDGLERRLEAGHPGQ